jgi:hypothetical protein
VTRLSKLWSGALNKRVCTTSCLGVQGAPFRGSHARQWARALMLAMKRVFVNGGAGGKPADRAARTTEVQPAQQAQVAQPPPAALQQQVKRPRRSASAPGGLQRPKGVRKSIRKGGPAASDSSIRKGV